MPGHTSAFVHTYREEFSSKKCRILLFFFFLRRQTALNTQQKRLVCVVRRARAPLPLCNPLFIHSSIHTIVLARREDTCLITETRLCNHFVSRAGPIQHRFLPRSKSNTLKKETHPNDRVAPVPNLSAAHTSMSSYPPIFA